MRILDTEDVELIDCVSAARSEHRMEGPIAADNAHRSCATARIRHSGGGRGFAADYKVMPLKTISRYFGAVGGLTASQDSRPREFVRRHGFGTVKTFRWVTSQSQYLA